MAIDQMGPLLPCLHAGQQQGNGTHLSPSSPSLWPARQIHTHSRCRTPYVALAQSAIQQRFVCVHLKSYQALATTMVMSGWVLGGTLASTSIVEMKVSHPLHLLKQRLNELIVIQAHLGKRPQSVCQLPRPHAVPNYVRLQQSHELGEIGVSLDIGQGCLQAFDSQRDK